MRRGALAGIPAAALNAKASGPMLPGQQQISKPEFTLFARSMAVRMANPGAAPFSRGGVGRELIDGCTDRLCRPMVSQIITLASHRQSTNVPGPGASGYPKPSATAFPGAPQAI